MGTNAPACDNSLRYRHHNMGNDVPASNNSLSHRTTWELMPKIVTTHSVNTTCWSYEGLMLGHCEGMHFAPTYKTRHYKKQDAIIPRTNRVIDFFQGASFHEPSFTSVLQYCNSLPI